MEVDDEKKMGVQLISYGLERRRKMCRTKIFCELSSGIMWFWGTVPDVGCVSGTRNWWELVV